jgi:hypothetical protein
LAGITEGILNVNVKVLFAEHEELDYEIKAFEKLTPENELTLEYIDPNATIPNDVYWFVFDKILKPVELWLNLYVVQEFVKNKVMIIVEFLGITTGPKFFKFTNCSHPDCS